MGVSMKNLDFLKTDYNFEEFKGVYAGTLQGFYTVFQINHQTKKCKITIGAYKDGNTEEPVSLVKEALASVKQKADTHAQKAVLTLEYPIPSWPTFNSHKKKFESIKDVVFPLLAKNEYKSGGFLHGKNDGTIKLYKMGTEYLYLTESELLETEADLREKKETDKNTSENLLLGTIGVLGVALAGIALYVLVGKLNLYVWAVPVILCAVSVVVYKKLGKKITVISVIVIFVILCAALGMATVLEYAWRIYDEVKNDPEFMPVSFFEILKATPSYIINIPDIRRVVVKDVLVNGAVLLLASAVSLISAYRQEVRFIKITKLN